MAVFNFNLVSSGRADTDICFAQSWGSIPAVYYLPSETYLRLKEHLNVLLGGTWTSEIQIAPHTIYLTGVRRNSERYNEIYDAISMIEMKCKRQEKWRGAIYATGIPRELDVLSEDGTRFQWRID